MAKHKLRVQVTNEAVNDALVSARSVTLRERILSKLLGNKRRVTVLVPGNQVTCVEIVEPIGQHAQTREIPGGGDGQ